MAAKERVKDNIRWGDLQLHIVTLISIGVEEELDNFYVIGFALETENGERNALDKMKRKRLDAIVWNDASAIGAKRSTATILLRDGGSERIEARTKDTIANAIVRTAERLVRER